MLKKKFFKAFICFILIMVLFIPAGCSGVKETKIVEPKPEEPANIEKIEKEKNTVNKPIQLQVNFTLPKTREAIRIPFKSVDYKAGVDAYQIDSELGNIVNLEQYGEFSVEQKKLLAQNGFFVNPTSQEQLFYIYENNEYKKLPSFVTTDSVLQVYHIFYDYSLRTLENEKLLGLLEDLTESMLQKSIQLYDQLKNEEIKNIQLRNIAFFAVAQKALGMELPVNIPDEAETLCQKELELINAQEGFTNSPIFAFDLDYSQYKPRGHYTRNDDLKRYFKTMMWYGQAPFPLYTIDNAGNKVRTTDKTLQAILVTYILFLENEGTRDIVRWENIYDPTVFYVGKTDDLNIYHYRDLLLKVYGTEIDIDSLNEEAKLDELYKEADKLPEPQIKPKYSSVTTPTGKQLRFMGQRYIADSEIIQELVEPMLRPIPSGLDVMGVLGSERAYDLLINKYQEDEKWDKYPQSFAKMKEKFSKVGEATWQSNMYYGWLWVVQGLLQPYGEGYPFFMNTEAWVDKSLSTALGSWAELRHDTILYGKQSGAECGGGEEPPRVKGYVEPSIEVYEKLLWLTKYSRANLQERDILVGSMESKLQSFEDLLQFLIDCSVKELRNEELTADEYYQLLTYGALLEYLTSSFAGDGMRWYEITSETDKNMAVIADIHTIAPNQFSSGGYFEVGVGPAYEIYVVVPINGELFLTRGAVFSYYEFDSVERLTDEKWQQILKENKQPSQPDWLKSFITGEKEEIPEPANPYRFWMLIK